jgi:hypothetical protein
MWDFPHPIDQIWEQRFATIGAIVDRTNPAAGTASAGR